MGKKVTESKRWPNNCEWARLDCISLSRDCQRQLNEVNEIVDEPVIMRRINKVIEAMRQIEIKLIEVKNGG